VTDAVFGPKGKLIVTTSSDDATRVWDARTGIVS
jgi:WD40 repeat protein